MKEVKRRELCVELYEKWLYIEDKLERMRIEIRKGESYFPNFPNL